MFHAVNLAFPSLSNMWCVHGCTQTIQKHCEKEGDENKEEGRRTTCSDAFDNSTAPLTEDQKRRLSKYLYKKVRYFPRVCILAGNLQYKVRWGKNTLGRHLSTERNRKRKDLIRKNRVVEYKELQNYSKKV